MKLKEMALVAEIFTAVAVVISLIFVGLQVKQAAVETSLNTRAIQTNSYQDLTAQINSLSIAVASNPRLAELIAQDLPDISPEQLQLNNYFLGIFRQGELAYIQFESGIINEESLRSMLGPVYNALTNSSSASSLWPMVRSLNPRYRVFVDALLVDPDPFRVNGN